MKKNMRRFHPFPRSRSTGGRGFTLIELIISMALGLIVLAAMYGVFTLQSKHFSSQELIAVMQQNARMAIYILSREIRMAGYNPLETPGVFNFSLSPGGDRETNQNKIAFTYDYDGDGVEDSNDKEQVGFRLENLTLKRFSTGAVSWQPVVDNIETLDFEYTLNDGSTVQNPDAAQVMTIVKVRTTVTARASQVDPDYTNPTFGDRYRRYSLTVTITPRNLGY